MTGSDLDDESTVAASLFCEGGPESVKLAFVD